MGGVRAAWMLLALLAGAAAAASTTPTDTKRSGEDIQFGNQQNPPVSLLDDNAMAGAFPSSETSEESATQETDTHSQKTKIEPAAVAALAKEMVESLKEEYEQHQLKQQQQQQQEQSQAPPQQEREKQEVEDEEGGAGKEKESEEVQQEGGEQAKSEHQQDEAAVGEERRWDEEDNLWHNQPAAHDLYRTYLSAPLHFGRGVPSFASRSRRSPHLPPLRSHPIKGGTLAGVRSLLGRGPQRQKRDLRRFRRDLNMNGVDLDRLLKNVDMKELLALLSRPQHHQEGYGTVHYAPAPARYAPQPKLFPDYEEEWGESAEDLLRQSLRAERPAEEVVMPPSRVWRKSSAPPGYGLARVPGFKRSSIFRANTLQDTQPQQPARPYGALSPRDVYSLAAMLGADRDPLSSRIRRAVM